MSLFNPRFRDMREREDKAHNKLKFLYNQLVRKRDGDKAGLAPSMSLTVEETAELARIEAVLDAKDKGNQHDQVVEVVEELFVSMVALFRADDCKRKHKLVTHDQGHLVFVETNAASNQFDRVVVVQAALTYGFLVADHAVAPPVVAREESDRVQGEAIIIPDKAHPAWHDINRAFYEALGETRAMLDLALMVLPILSIEGDPDGRNGQDPAVDAAEFAFVIRELHKRGVTTEENQLRRKVNEALNKYQNVASDDVVDGVFLDPPDLGEISGVTIEKENVRLIGPMIVSAMMDEVKAFQTLDRIVERFQDATLVRFSREAGRKLYEYWREAPNRMSEMERRTFYAITLGLPGGEPTEFTNTAFNDLFLRFVSSVSDLTHQKELDHVLRATIPFATHQQQARKAARDLIENLSMHGYGMAFYAAQELSKQVNTIIDILNDPDIRANFGARDMWQVIDQVATLELGGAKSTSRYRTLATCGTIITAWLANNIELIMSTTGPFIDMNDVRYPQPKPSGQKAITHPNAYDLVNACELWLADSAISDTRVEELTQPGIPSDNITAHRGARCSEGHAWRRRPWVWALITG